MSHVKFHVNETICFIIPTKGVIVKNESLIGWLPIHPHLSLLDYFGVFDPKIHRLATICCNIHLLHRFALECKLCSNMIVTIESIL